MLVEGWLTRAASAHPARIALETPAGSWSYAELHAAARLGASDLRARGARSGERVALALPPGLAFAQAFHACLLLGAVAVPVDLRLAPSERARIADGASVLVDEALAAPPSAGIGKKGPARDDARDSRPAPESPVEEQAQVEGEDLREGGGKVWEGSEVVTHDLDAVAAIIHTSGTTSAPRPVELTYGNFLWSALGSAVALGLDPRERWLCTLPVSHVGGLSILVRSTIYATTVVVHERFDTDRVLDALRARDITLVSLVATTLARLLDAGLSYPTTSSGRGASGLGASERGASGRGASLRCALTGGGPVPEALLTRARDAGVPVSLTYGLTEACSQVTTATVATPGVRATAGPPLFCTRVRIAADGEIMVAGPTVAPGSLGGDGWLRTGDLGVLDEQGRLSVTGRKADTIVSGGENVAPAEVEAVLEAHPDVLEAAVVGRPDARWGEAVTAIVLARPGRTLDGEALRAHCARRLAPYKVPKQVVLTVEPLPRTPSGKLLRRELS
jgi:O-succinylbenzoic acid--CoA ligase